jgi:hypothetical protein
MEEQRPVDAPAQQETPAKPVDNPNLPSSGDDPGEFTEEPVADTDYQDAEEASEKPEDPNDLSGVEKEFEE